MGQSSVSEFDDGRGDELWTCSGRFHRCRNTGGRGIVEFPIGRSCSCSVNDAVAVYVASPGGPGDEPDLERRRCIDLGLSDDCGRSSYGSKRHRGFGRRACPDTDICHGVADPLNGLIGRVLQDSFSQAPDWIASAGCCLV